MINRESSVASRERMVTNYRSLPLGLKLMENCKVGGYDSQLPKPPTFYNFYYKYINLFFERYNFKPILKMVITKKMPFI
jgi:hypothetical protein